MPADTDHVSNAAVVPPTDTSVSKATTVTIGTTSTLSRKSSEDKLHNPNEEVSSINAVHEVDIDPLSPTRPLRIATTQMMFESRLTGSCPNLLTRENMLLRRKDPLSSRSGSESPLFRGSSSMTFDGNSSISSLDAQGIDTDILTDKMGVLELDLKAQQEISQSLHKSLSNLPAVNERLRDETLEDCHAFTDLKREGTLSRGGSIATGGEITLEPLEEIADEGDPASKIKITNLAEILEAPDEEEIGDTATNNASPQNPST